ncbi:FAD-binding and (Fe-S)-binding domain-containing protein [Marinomonas sp. IMCC 4694]|uniref:FAD-binding and (Fe-S)-binding domain-containing protein n=1 Tax=Marinomonas sp. IMCC 4694 TaxID=2605432 RepID=UPI0011E6B489|nr:FAD-binding and (Fe-S)-binding domain-containing protein [Marinomonas sp. IMCC 4694]TYL46523.1 FAD-binding oxidoreductase [Marinomonas sp. IMCC 4694]
MNTATTDKDSIAHKTAQYRDVYFALKDAKDGAIDESRLIQDPLRTLAYGTDASFYRLIPQLVVRVDNEDEVRLVLKEARERSLPVTFRAAGTSLSGQAVTDSILMQLSDNWKGHRVHQHGHRISLQPGVIGARANQILAPFQRKIGPDPASINACMIGGIAANNASGMCCGTAQNSYHTVQSARLIFADGSLLDTADESSRLAFRVCHGPLLETLTRLSKNVQANAALAEKIRHKYRLKNTTGYSLNSLTDFDDPFDILLHLMIGSEGTLGFISEVTYDTVVDHPTKAAAMIFFDDMETTCRAVMALKTSPVAAVELIDRAGLRAVEGKPGMPEALASLGDNAAGLLVDVRAENGHALEANLALVVAALNGQRTLNAIEFTQDKALYDSYWKIRKGLFPAVGAVRPVGTTVIIEDVAFPIEQLAEGVLELQSVFQKHGYREAILFGHALEGNLHFVFTQGFDDPKEITRYEQLMDEVAQLVAVKYKGSLKAEHGTGRNMAPYVELEWGKEAYDIMWEIKGAFDPLGLLNPDVVLSRNANLHVQNLKPMPKANDKVDTCIECGFCESSCPSKSVTLTPRQRIVIWREIQGLMASGDQPERLAELKKDYDYQGVDTCAGCGLCSMQCPVGINTGDLTREIRHDRHPDSKVGYWVADHFSGVTKSAKTGLSVAHAARGLIGNGGMKAVTSVMNKVSGGAVPKWHNSMPTAASAIPRHQLNGTHKEVVYFPSCATRMMGAGPNATDKRSVMTVMFSVLEKAGYNVIVPKGIESQCCGMAFHSKGQFGAAKQKSSELNALLLKASDNGRIPIICDVSPCTLRMQESLDDCLALHEQVSFLSTHVMPTIRIAKKLDKMALHVTCSTTRMGLADSFVQLAHQLADEVVIPPDITCCGFAGDKGFSTPELNASALKTLAKAVEGCEVGYSNSRTCEIGLSEHSGIEYQSIVYLVDQLSEASAS